MKDQELHELLAELQTEIEQTEPEDERGRELLRHLQADIRGYLDRSEEERSQPEDTFLERLDNAVDHFEIEYPRLTMLLSQISNILSNAGI